MATTANITAIAKIVNPCSQLGAPQGGRWIDIELPEQPLPAPCGKAGQELGRTLGQQLSRKLGQILSRKLGRKLSQQLSQN